MKTLTLAALLGMGLVMPLAATAAPALHPAAPATTAIEHVAGGCGRGFHRGAYGRCRPNRPPPRLERRACPPGYHLTPRGCLRNY